jgi:hypothetical protein
VVYERELEEMTVPSVLRSFKQHYHKVGNVAQQFGQSNVFDLIVDFDGSEIRASSSTADEDLTIQFVVLMRRFLNASDPLYYENVWAMLEQEFPDELSPETVGEYEARVGNLRGGSFSLSIDGEEISAEGIYDGLSRGEYFGRDDAARSYLRRLFAIPLVKQLCWNEFYAYTCAGLDVASAVFDAICDVEQTEKYQGLCRTMPEAQHRCIYCLATPPHADFTSEEHVLPESLGNYEMVLAPGHVCDSCNHGLLAQLDSDLLAFLPVAVLQVLFVPHSKSGKLPEARFQNLWMRKKRPGQIDFIAQDRSGLPQDREDLGDGWVSFTTLIRGNRFDPKALARSLYKVGLGAVALSQGDDHACDARYDAARQFLRGGGGFPNSLLMCTEVHPNPQVIVSYHDRSPGTPVFVSIYGLDFIFNLEAEPQAQLIKPLEEMGYQQYALWD